MGVGGQRLTVNISISGSSQSSNLPLSLERLNQIILTSSEAGHTFTLEIINEQGDVVYGPIDVAAPDNRTRPNLIPKGILTVRITNPIPASGTITAVAITEAR